MVGKAIGILPSDIYSNRRNLGKISEYIARQGTKFDLGDSNALMQLYISKHSDNVETVDSQIDWVDYILTRDWIERLGKSSIGQTQQDV